MRTRRVWLACVGALAMFAPAGCMTFLRPPAPAQAQEVPPLPASAGVKKARELSAAEAAPLCLATAETLYKSGDDLQAVALFEKARAAGSRDHAISRRLAILYGRNGEGIRSREEFQRAISARPNDPELYNDMGYLAYAQGKPADAEGYLRQAIRMDAKHKRAWVNLGLVLGLQSRYMEAFEAFTQVLPEAQAQANMAFLYTTQGKREEARRAYRLALRAEPEMHVARAALAKLERDAPEPRHGDGVMQARHEEAAPVGGGVSDPAPRPRINERGGGADLMPSPLPFR